MPIRFTLITMEDDSPCWRIHRDGCKDIQRDRQRAVVSYGGIESDSAETLVQVELEDGGLRDMGYNEHDFKIMPCCHE